MKQCRFCDNFVEESVEVCFSCGYNFKTDRVNPSFVPGKKNMKRGKPKEPNVGNSAGVSSGVKKFAFVGLIIVAFSILYKYNFNLNDLSSDAIRIFSKIKSGKFTLKSDNKKDKEEKKVELINVLSFLGPKEGAKDKDLKIQGISYDPNAKSFVVINGKLISERESFRNLVVKKIHKDAIEAIVDGKYKILRVNQIIPLSKD